MIPQETVIGILGGGQLAKMSAQAGRKLSFRIRILDPTPGCPASQVAEQTVGSFRDPEMVRTFAETCHILTFDLEHVDVSPLFELKTKVKVIPAPETLALIQNKFDQRRAYLKAGLPVPRFSIVSTKEELERELPAVQKALVGGYDGRGTVILKSREDLEKALPLPSLIEEYLEIEKEIALIVVRDERGDFRIYDPVEMVFHPEGNLLDYLFCPADLSERLMRDVKELALEAVRAIDGVGLFGVELFLDRRENLYINEIAPRPHNSGHHTIEACVTSQFEQHIRVITGLPLGDARLLAPAVMLNLLGEPGFYGKPIYEGLEKVLAIPGVSVHIYGKRETFPLRKMGHVTVLGETLQEALNKAMFVKETLKVKGEVRR